MVRIAAGWHASKHIKHRVTEIIAPWGPPIKERPAIPSEEELSVALVARKIAKLERRAQRIENGEAEGESRPKKSRPGGVKVKRHMGLSI